MAANETHQSDKITWEQPGVVTSDGTLRAGKGRSRFGTDELIGDGPYDVHFTPWDGQAEVIARRLPKRRAYEACPEHNKKLLAAR
jgi:hypothetical protein